MSIKIHHLNCGTMCPLCQRLMNSRDGSWTQPGHFVCHCLLIETPETLLLVDTGLGQQDVTEPKRRLGASYTPLFRPKLAMEETALSQVRALGYDPRDVRQIAVTHLDLDHAGGLSDFPDAQVHLLKPELQQIQQPGWRERGRFRWPQFDHQPKWVTHEEDHGESWFGFTGIRAIPGLSTDILLIPLIGHTRGHMGVAVRNGDKWLLHCGDAYYHHSQVTANSQVPSGSIFFQKVIAAVPHMRVHNLARLQQLAINHSDEVELICAHDPVDLARYTTNSLH
jgi:glyoxylase-like metal-dependent hydrolase (beta-lactamase superfamily II)